MGYELREGGRGPRATLWGVSSILWAVEGGESRADGPALSCALLSSLPGMHFRTTLLQGRVAVVVPAPYQALRTWPHCSPNERAFGAHFTGGGC